MTKKKVRTKTGIGPRVRQWRESQNMRGCELAKIIGISQSTLSDMENGKTDPSARTIVNLLERTRIDQVWVFTGIRGAVLKGEIPEIKESPGEIILARGSKITIRASE